VERIDDGGEELLRSALKKKNEADGVDEDDERSRTSGRECGDRDSNPDGVTPTGF
jgi:hypothetical protein